MKRLAPVVAAMVMLLPGCASLVDPHLWDPDGPVLPPLAVAGAKAATEPPEPRLKQYVVLLPDADGTVGVVEVTRGESTARLTEPYQAVRFDSLSETFTVETPEVEGSFSSALIHEPPAPAQFTVYFDLGETDLTGTSNEFLPTILTAILKRTSPEVWVRGYTDRSGPTEKNVKLSRARAGSIRDLLVDAGLAPEAVEVEWFGENRLAVSTDDGLAEPRNRRVVIDVR